MEEEVEEEEEGEGVRVLLCWGSVM